MAQRLIKPRLSAKRGAPWAVVGVAALAASSTGCLPEGEPTGTTQPTAKPRPAPVDRRPPRRPQAAASSAAGAPSEPPITQVFEDRFDRASLGPDWNALSAAWTITDGALCAAGARNRGVWLRRILPVNARVEFDARSDSPEGDIKAELWGDGRTGATSASYTDATSYLTILGGWKNTRHVLARLDEHGKDRLEIEVENQSGDPRAQAVEPGQTYRFRVERSDGHTISWWVDDQLYFELDDPDPLSGPGHNHVGFNDWTVPVCFDNLKITPL